LDLLRALAEVENQDPKDDLIVDYRDFLKHRQFLHYYQFNPAVFTSLLSLTVKLWTTKKRISRLSLVTALKRYGYTKDILNKKRIFELKNVPKTVANDLFELFKFSHDHTNYYKLSPIQYKEITNGTNSLLIGQKLNDTSLQWLCTHYELHPNVLNRILRYPFKSSFISAWVRRHYHDDKLVSRRAELASWMIDEDSEFKVTRQRIIKDFEIMIKEDEDELHQFKFDYDVSQALNAELSNDSLFEESIIDAPKYDMPHRPYNFVIDTNKKHGLYGPILPDLNETKKHFLTFAYRTVTVTNLWSVAYSRLSKAQKSKRLLKDCTTENIWSLIKICKKYKLLEPLKIFARTA